MTQQPVAVALHEHPWAYNTNAFVVRYDCGRSGETVIFGPFPDVDAATAWMLADARSDAVELNLPLTEQGTYCHITDDGNTIGEWQVEPLVSPGALS